MPKKGVKIWQTEVADNDSWRAEVAKDGLMIVELFSEFFGHTEILAPMVDDLMKQLGPDNEDKIRWRRVNLLNLEEELRSLEEEKQRSSRDANADEAGAEEEDGEENAAEKGDGGDGAGGAEADGQPSEEPVLSKGVQGLTHFAGFHHPQPFFIFMRKGEIIDIMRSLNPPKLEELTKLYLSDVTAKNKDLTYEIMLKTEEEIKAEKGKAAKLKALNKKINAIAERVECEDPMVLTSNEAMAIFGMFVIDEEFKGPPLPEDTTWEDFAAGFEGKSIDAVCNHFTSLGEEGVDAVQAHLDAKEQATKAAEAEAAEKAAAGAETAAGVGDDGAGAEAAEAAPQAE